MKKTSRWDRYLGITAPMTQVPVPTARDGNNIIDHSDGCRAGNTCRRGGSAGATPVPQE